MYLSNFIFIFNAFIVIRKNVENLYWEMTRFNKNVVKICFEVDRKRKYLFTYTIYGHFLIRKIAKRFNPHTKLLMANQLLDV